MLTRVLFTAIAMVTLAVGAVMLSLPTPETSNERTAETSAGLVIRNVDIFDGTAWLDDHDVAVRDGRIVEIGIDLSVSDDMQPINGDGQTLLPGLIDAHTHIFGAALTDSLRFGVTTNLDMFTAPGLLAGNATVRERFDQTTLSDFYSAGNMATIDGGHGTQFGIPIETLSTPEEAFGWVSRRIEEGSDYIKLAYIPGQSQIPSLDRATAAAIIRAGHNQGVMVVAHISTMQAAQDMIDDGVDGLVHLFADVAVSETFIDAAREHEVFIIPTLAVIASVANTQSSVQFAADPRIAPFLTPVQMQSLQNNFPGSIPGFDLDLAQDNVRRLHAAGIVILAGSDAPNPGTTYGASLLHEIELLVASGLTITDALHAATLASAEQFSLDGRGRVAVGARADLVIINGDPRVGLASIRDINTVLKNGYIVERTIAAPSPNARIETATLGEFETGLGGEAPVSWSPTDDSMMGGASSATLSHVQPGADGSAGAVSIDASVQRGFFAPWAGLSMGLEQTGSLAGYDQIVFQVRGTPGEYSVMMFSSTLAGAPPSQRFEVTESWQMISMNISDFTDFNPEDFVGMAIVAGPQSGEFVYEIDNVRLQ
jgi:imidazolonepropionase-like amidohydrolase